MFFLNMSLDPTKNNKCCPKQISQPGRYVYFSTVRYSFIPKKGNVDKMYRDETDPSTIQSTLHYKLKVMSSTVVSKLSTSPHISAQINFSVQNCTFWCHLKHLKVCARIRICLPNLRRSHLLISHFYIISSQTFLHQYKISLKMITTS